MKKYFSFLVALCGVLVISTQAFANVKTYLVAPFKVNGPSDYAYLEKSIPSMIASRLFWSGNFETDSTQDSFTKTRPIESRQAAAKAIENKKADYLFFGSVTILGNEASVDMTAISKQGQVWQNATSAKVDNLITELQNLTDTFASQVFKKKVSSRPRGEFVGRVPTSGSIIEAEESSRFVSSSFYYEDQDTARLRSQTLPIAAVSMDMADIDNDGVEDFIFADSGNSVFLYSWNNGTLQPKAEFELPGGVRALAVRFFEQKGKMYIAYSGFSDHEGRPLGTILELNGSQLVEVADRIPYYLNTTILPGINRRTLIAQSYSTEKIFRGAVFELYIDRDKYTKGPNLPNLPRVANVYNFAYVPSDGSTNIAILEKSEKIAVYATSGKRLYQTTDTYSGGNAYIRLYQGELTGDLLDDAISYYYVPMRMLALDLDNNSKTELLANRPISAAAGIFKNFRSYPQGEVQAFAWDEYTLAMLWKTKRINGTVADIHLGDPNNDGILDLVITIVSYPGALGMGDRKTFVSLFPLELDEIQSAPGDKY